MNLQQHKNKWKNKYHSITVFVEQMHCSFDRCIVSKKCGFFLRSKAFLKVIQVKILLIVLKRICYPFKTLVIKTIYNFWRKKYHKVPTHVLENFSEFIFTNKAVIIYVILWCQLVIKYQLALINLKTIIQLTDMKVDRCKIHF